MFIRHQKNRTRLLSLPVVLVVLSMNCYSANSIAESNDDMYLKELKEKAEKYSDSNQIDSLYYTINTIVNEIENRTQDFSAKRIYNIAYFMEKMSEFDYSVLCYEKAGEKAIMENNNQMLVESRNRLAYVLSQTGEFDEAVKIILSNIAYVEDNNFSEFQEDVHVYGAFVYRNTSNEEKAFEFFKKALSFTDSTSQSSLYHVILSEMGNYYINKSDFQMGTQYLLRALDIRKGLKLDNYLGYSYHDISVAFTQKKSLTRLLNLLFWHWIFIKFKKIAMHFPMCI